MLTILIQKNRFPPCIGSSTVVVARLAQNLMSRQSRWRQLQLCERDASVAFIIDLLELVKLGYTFEIVKRSLHACAGYDI